MNKTVINNSISSNSVNESTNETDSVVYKANDEINDVRTKKDFRGKTFSGYKLSDVKNIINKELLANNVNDTYYWIVELLCAGHLEVIWEIFNIYLAQNIGSANPKLAVYLNIKHQEFVKVYRAGYVNHELLLRNNTLCRNILCEIVNVLCYSPKQPTMQKFIVMSTNDFSLDNLTSKLAAPNDKFITDIFKEDDPIELFIPLNELSYSLSIFDKNNNCKENLWNSLYWFEWILQYEKYSKERGNVLKSTYRNIKVDSSYRKDIIWIIWDVIFFYTNKTQLQKKIMQSLFELFCSNFKPGSKQKHKHLIYNAIDLIINSNNISFNTPIIIDKDLIDCGNIGNITNKIFIEIKKNEHSSNTEYLFNNINERSHAEKTAEKINKLQNIM
tara:strand:- start:283 stop:1443 length:1161 start_codon:yes stop_codon:yes gene_type:complete